MEQVTTIGLDIAKRVFQVHGVGGSGAVVLRRQLKRGQVVRFFAKLPGCLIGLEACGTAHHWGRQLQGLGHDVRLIPPLYAKAYVRRNKTDPADAEAICEAVSRPWMRFVPIKSAADQAMASVHRVRERLIGQRTMVQNMLRGQMAEFGIVAAKGAWHVKELVARLEDPDSLPEPLRLVLLGLGQVLAELDRETRGDRCSDHGLAQGQPDEPGPRHHSRLWPDPVERNGGACGAARTLCRRTRPGRLDRSGAQAGLFGRHRAAGPDQYKQGDGYLRRLLINGAQAVLNSRRAQTDPWIRRLLATKPRLVAAVALANKMARIAWAVMVRQTRFRQAVAVA